MLGLPPAAHAGIWLLGACGGALLLLTGLDRRRSARVDAALAVSAGPALFLLVAVLLILLGVWPPTVA